MDRDPEVLGGARAVVISPVMMVMMRLAVRVWRFTFGVPVRADPEVQEAERADRRRPHGLGRMDPDVEGGEAQHGDEAGRERDQRGAAAGPIHHGRVCELYTGTDVSGTRPASVRPSGRPGRIDTDVSFDYMN